MIIYLVKYSKATRQIRILSYIQFLTQGNFFLLEERRWGRGGGGLFQLDMESSANVSQNATY